MVLDLVEGVKQGNRRAVARLLTEVESHSPQAVDALRALHDRIGQAHVIGITGSPGTGKSTLTDRLIEFYRREGKRVAVMAVDPSSPFTGGAILGDRIRMQHRSTDPGVFIRSIGTRGALGGLSASTGDAVKVLDAAGYDVVIVETVGVGQAEVDVIRLADTVCVVLVPNLGDDVQAVKAGVMEIADVFVVNKSDLDGSDKVHAEVEASMNLGHPDEDDFWWPPIVRTVAEKGTGLSDLAAAVGEHRAWAERTGHWHTRRLQRMRRQVRDLLQRSVVEFAFKGEAPRPQFVPWFEEAQSGNAAPQDVAERIIAAYKQA